MEPIFEALNSGKLPLTAKSMDAVRQIKNAVANATLSIPKPGKELRLEADASGTSVGAILTQEGRPIAYMSTCHVGYPQQKKDGHRQN